MTHPSVHPSIRLLCNIFFVCLYSFLISREHRLRRRRKEGNYQANRGFYMILFCFFFICHRGDSYMSCCLLILLFAINILSSMALRPVLFFSAAVRIITWLDDGPIREELEYMIVRFSFYVLFRVLMYYRIGLGWVYLNGFLSCQAHWFQLYQSSWWASWILTNLVMSSPLFFFSPTSEIHHVRPCRSQMITWFINKYGSVEFLVRVRLGADTTLPLGCWHQWRRWWSHVVTIILLRCEIILNN